MTGSHEPRSGTATNRALLTDPRLLVVTLLSLVGTLGTNVAAPALPALGAGLGVADARLGLVITAYTLPAMVAVPIVGVLADLHGRRVVVIPSLAAFGAAGVAVTTAGSFETVLLFRGLQGVAFAGIMPMSVTILGDLYEGDRGSTAQGIRVSLNGISSIVVPAIAGAISALAWHVPFFLYAAAFPAVVVAYVWLPETAGDRPGPAGVSAQLRGYVAMMRGELRRPRTATLVAGGGVRDFVRYAVLTFVPLFAVRSLDASFAEAGALLSLRGVAYILVAPLAGRIVGVVSPRYALAGSLVGGAVTVALIPGAPGIVAAAGIVLAYSVTDAVFSPVIKDAVTDAASATSRAGLVGGMNVFKYAGQSASPVAFGLVLAAAGFDVLFAAGGAILAAYAVAVVVILR